MASHQRLSTDIGDRFGHFTLTVTQDAQLGNLAREQLEFDLCIALDCANQKEEALAAFNNNTAVHLDLR